MVTGTFLLALDVGNTDSVFGFFRGEALVYHRRVSTKAILKNKVQKNAVCNSAIVSSVVPKINRSLKKFLKEKLKIKKVIFVNHRMNLPIKLKVDRPSEVGADRIVNNSAAYLKYGGPLLVIDFGTATTLDYIDTKGVYQGGMIIPGLKISAEALFQKAAKLPAVKLKIPRRLLGKNTVHQMQSGIVLGYAAMIEGLILKISRQSKRAKRPKNLKVILTGGMGHLLSPLISSRHVFDPFLTLKGLNHLAK